VIKERPTCYFEHFDDITCEYRAGPVLKRRQLGKVLIGTTVAGWALIVFQFQDFTSGAWALPRTSVQRWKKVDGYWRCVSRMHFRHGRALEALQAAAQLEVGWQERAAASDAAIADELPSRRRKAAGRVQGGDGSAEDAARSL
jgi:hypothetical protein